MVNLPGSRWVLLSIRGRLSISTGVMVVGKSATLTVMVITRVTSLEIIDIAWAKESKL